MFARSIWKFSILFIILVISSVWNITSASATINNNGSGYCWESGAAWSSSSVTYKTDSTIPAGWISNINTSAATWTNIGSSSFTFSNNSSSANIISKGGVANPSNIAVTTTYGTQTTIIKDTVVFNQNKSFSTSLPAPSGSYWVTEVMTHEFGHWLRLKDTYLSTCDVVTMYGNSVPGESLKSSLTSFDINGAAWQYP